MLTFLYRGAVEDASLISYGAQCAKVARHSRCSSCRCRGLHPRPEWAAVADNSDEDEVTEVLDAVGTDDALTDDGFLAYCACGHPFEEHGCEDTSDLVNRAAVAARIDAYLVSLNKLLDFDYVDEEVLSLREELSRLHARGLAARDQSPSLARTSRSSSSPLSDAPAPSNALAGSKRRFSTSSLSDEDEENRPLASRAFLLNNANESQISLLNATQDEDVMEIDADPDADSTPLEPIAAVLDMDVDSSVPPPSPGNTAPGKSAKSQMGLAHQAPGTTVRALPEKVALAAAAAEANAKAEVRRTVGGADEGLQVDRLATGVTVDAGALRSSAKRERPSEVEERAGTIQFVVVDNDGTPRNSILLTGLKCLFQKQLPNMPREYITRLVFDRSAQGLAIVQRGLKVVGGIAYRPFPQRHFAEIVFFAISGVYQVNGYGVHLMNHFKMHIRNNYPSISHFLTYADNYAIGYFKKQGFKREITLPRELWVGYIKDYEGGTLMQCTMLPKVNYLATRDLLHAQREAIITKMQQRSNSHVIHVGLEQFKKPLDAPLNPKDIPGLQHTGWTPEMDEMLRRPGRGIYFMAMKRLLAELKKHEASWPFLVPVNPDEVTDYREVIKYPMDFQTMETKLERDAYNDFESFVADARLIFANCKLYNHEASQYTKLAIRMEKFLDECLAKLPSYKQESGR